MVWLRMKSDFLDFSLPQLGQFLQDIKFCSPRRIGGVKELELFISLDEKDTNILLLTHRESECISLTRQGGNWECTPAFVGSG